MTATITDFGQFTELRAVAGRDEQAALREVAGQFEALFVETLLKGMRQASLGDGIVGDSDQLAMYQGMLDQQLALEMSSGNGIGLADLLVRQLGAPAETAQRPPDRAISVPGMRGGIQRAAPPEPPGWPDPTEFARDVWPYAERAARLLDVAPEAIVAQAALETGWGEFVMPDSGGDNSFNLFGIKAGSSWRGASVSRNTLEFENGIPHPRQARFRARVTDRVGSARQLHQTRDRNTGAQGFQHLHHVGSTFPELVGVLIGLQRHRRERHHQGTNQGVALAVAPT